MKTETEDILQRLRGAALVIGCAPELPGYNGSVVTIDDVEATRCAIDIYAGVAEIERLLAETVRLDSAAQERERCAAYLDALHERAAGRHNYYACAARELRDGN